MATHMIGKCKMFYRIDWNTGLWYGVHGTSQYISPLSFDGYNGNV